MNQQSHAHSEYAGLRGRVLHFVRHGQYHSGETASGGLTTLGRKQAALTAKHFAKLPIERIFSSDLPRAVETADILGSRLGIVHSRHRLLREVLPAHIPGMKIELRKRADGAHRIERILSRFFRTSPETRHEVIVCHGNLIRALVVRVASGRADGFHRLIIHHCSVTSFLISRRGIEVLTFNAQAHLPGHLCTEW